MITQKQFADKLGITSHSFGSRRRRGGVPEPDFRTPCKNSNTNSPVWRDETVNKYIKSITPKINIIDIKRLIKKGYTKSSIAKELGVKLKTVDNFCRIKKIKSLNSRPIKEYKQSKETIVYNLAQAALNKAVKLC